MKLVPKPVTSGIGICLAEASPDLEMSSSDCSVVYADTMCLGELFSACDQF